MAAHIWLAYYSFYRPQKDERLIWPSWLTCSGWFSHISSHPSAAGPAQDRESSPVTDRRSATVLPTVLVPTLKDQPFPSYSALGGSSWTQPSASASGCAAFGLGFPTSCLRRHVGAPTGSYPKILLHAIMKISGFCGAGEDNGGRGTNSPGGRHPNRTNQYCEIVQESAGVKIVVIQDTNTPTAHDKPVRITGDRQSCLVCIS